MIKASHFLTGQLSRNLMQITNNAFWLLHNIFCTANGQYDEPVEADNLESFALFMLDNYEENDFRGDVGILLRAGLINSVVWGEGKVGYSLTQRGLY